MNEIIRVCRKIGNKGLKNSASVVARRLSSGVQEHVVGPLLSPLREGQIAMFHVGRSGSTVLGNCLDQHSQIYWGGEIYKPHLDDAYDPIQVLQKERRKSGRNYFGFEVKPFHLRQTSYALPEYIEALTRQGVEHFILLRRKNLLRKIVSSVIAEKYKYHLSSEEDTQMVQAEIDINEVAIDRTRDGILDHLKRYINEYETIRENMSDKKSLEITYEEDVYESPLKAYSKVTDYMAIKTEQVKVEFSKTNPFPLNRLIMNYREVEQFLKESDHEWMLYA